MGIIRGKVIYGKGNNVGMHSKLFLEMLNSIEDSDLIAMDSVDLLTIINQGILPSNKAIDSIITTEPFSEERKNALTKIKASVDNGENITESTRSEEEIPMDEEDGDKSNENAIEDIKTQTSPKKEESEEDKKLAKLRLMKSFKSIDSSLINAIDDTEAISVLMANKMRKMWESLINNAITVDDIVKECNNAGKFYKLLASRFIDEYNSIISYNAPKGFSAHKKHKDGSIEYYTPNLMQKLIVNRLKKNHYYGNWSGMGSGKTLSSIIASREIDSHLTVIVALNSTIKQWADDIYNAYPKSTGTCVYMASDKSYDSFEFDMSKYNYLLIPYSRLSQINEDKRLKKIADNGVDFIVIDEVHKAKKRGEDSEDSRRRERLLKLIGWSKEKNPNLFEMVMSGTPIINELSEAKSLLTLLTGNTFEDIKTNRTLSNALKLHQMLLINGMRFMPKYDQEINILTSENTSVLKINGDKYLNELDGAKSINIEKLFVNDKLHSVQSYLKKGTIIYTHYTTGFISTIRNFVEENGFTVSLYTGENESNREEELDKFKNGETDILIASDPINTGVNGLQDICDTMIIITLPWTNADFEQLKGRIYRQGMRKDTTVSIIIPQVIVHYDNNEWSWDKQRYDVIRMKKSIADCVIDGVIPSKAFPKRETMFRKSIEAISIWKKRANNEDFLVREDTGTTIDLTVETEEYIQKRESQLNEYNRKGRTTSADNMHRHFTEHPEDFIQYHTP